MTMAEIKIGAAMNAIMNSGGSVKKAAKELNISRTTLYRILSKIRNLKQEKLNVIG